MGVFLNRVSLFIGSLFTQKGFIKALDKFFQWLKHALEYLLGDISLTYFSGITILICYF